MTEKSALCKMNCIFIFPICFVFRLCWTTLFVHFCVRGFIIFLGVWVLHPIIFSSRVRFSLLIHFPCYRGKIWIQLSFSPERCSTLWKKTLCIFLNEVLNSFSSLVLFLEIVTNIEFISKACYYNLNNLDSRQSGVCRKIKANCIPEPTCPKGLYLMCSQVKRDPGRMRTPGS